MTECLHIVMKACSGQELSQRTSAPETPDCPLASTICKRLKKKQGYANYTISHILQGNTGNNCLWQLTETGHTLSMP